MTIAPLRCREDGTACFNAYCRMPGGMCILRMVREDKERGGTMTAWAWILVSAIIAAGLVTLWCIL